MLFVYMSQTIAQVPECLKNLNLFAGLRVLHKRSMASHFPVDQFKETEHVIQNDSVIIDQTNIGFMLE